MNKQIKKAPLIFALMVRLINAEPLPFVKDGLKIFEQINGDPNSFQNHFLRANMLIQFQEFNHALEHLDIVLKAVPTASAALYNKGYLLKITGKPAEAIPYYQKVVNADSSNVLARLGLSHAYLALGNYQEGLPLFEHRLANPTARNFTPLDFKEINGKKIVIVQESFGGLGDWIMMIRFAQLLKDHGARVIAQTPDPLISLFTLCPYIDELCSTKKSLPTHDKAILLMNLPLSCKATLPTLPNKPYLYADATLVSFWQQKIAHDRNFKIGLCWGEMPQVALIQTSAYGRRSMPLEKLAPISKIPGISLYSLQKVDGLEQLSKIPAEMNITIFDTDFDESHGRFMDTAALMKNMDLVITLDTAPAHLAGALGITTWLYLPYAPEWRWMVERTDSPWYPTMRLFRQHHPGNWDEVVKDMVTALPELIAQKKSSASGSQYNDACHLLADDIIGKL